MSFVIRGLVASTAAAGLGIGVLDVTGSPYLGLGVGAATLTVCIYLEACLQIALNRERNR